MSLVLADVQPTENPKITEITVLEEIEGMTNGEVIKALFPYVETEDTPSNKVIATDLDGSYCLFMREWWNAPYKAESEDKAE